MRCVLIFNPCAGRNRHLKNATVCKIRDALRELGHSVELTPTTAPGSATLQAQEAIRSGAEIIFACGGDGTIHEVLQGLVSENGEAAYTLGIIPLGSANALARHLRLSLDPLQAALDAMQGEARMIPVGKLAYGDHVRYFTVMAGAGPDGALVYRLLTEHKSKLGRAAYYLHAARLFSTRRFRPFEIEFTDVVSNESRSVRTVCGMTTRIEDLGGLFSRLTGGQASVDDAHLRLIILRGPALLSLPLWFMLGWVGLNRINPFLRFADVTSFSCAPLTQGVVRFQADGEWLGQIPMRVSIVPNALRILLPAREPHLTHGRNIGCG